MFFNKSFGIGAHLVMAAGTLLGMAGAANAADGPDVRVSISFGRPIARPVVVRPLPECDYAGTLTIDGRSFRIDSSCSVREQIHEAFECMGYDAWCVGRSVRIRTGRCAPEVCWRTGEYSIEFRERRGSITITPFVDDCHDHHGHRHVRFAYDAPHGYASPGVHGGYRTYEEVSVDGGVSWRDNGLSTFVEHDRDLEVELHGRGDDRGDSRERYEQVKPDDRRATNVRRDARVVDERSSVPQRVNDRKRTPEVSRKAVTPRVAETKRAELPKALPSDRLGDVKVGTKRGDAEKKAAKPSETKKQESAPTKRGSTDDRTKRW